ncbi:MAG: GNAT family N-acetyltransferase [Nitrospirota bacterium]
MNRESLSLHIEEVTTGRGLEALVPEWSALWARSPSATPFQTPEWLLPWWRHIGRGELLVITVRCEGRLVGLAPLFIDDGPGYDGPACCNRRIALLGSGITDYLDVLFEPDAAPAGTAAVFRYLLRERARWELCDLREIRTTSPLLGCTLSHGLSARIRPLEACPVLELPESIEALRSGISAAQRVRVDRARRAVDSAGSVLIESAREETTDEFLDDFFGLSYSRRTGEGESAPGEDGATELFHRVAAYPLQRRAYLRLYRLRVNGSTAAVVYGLRGRDAFYCYRVRTNPVFSRLSPGIVLIDHAIEEAIAEGMREFDFLRGREKLKYLWGACDRMNYRITIDHLPLAAPRSAEGALSAAAVLSGRLQENGL